MLSDLRQSLRGILEAAERGARRAALDIEALERKRRIPVTARVTDEGIVVTSSAYVAEHDSEQWSGLLTNALNRELSR
jgi:hypothetical protein